MNMQRGDEWGPSDDDCGEGRCRIGAAAVCRCKLDPKWLRSTVNVTQDMWQCRSWVFGPIKWWPSAAGNGFWRATRCPQIAFAVFMFQLGISCPPQPLNAFYLIWAKKKNNFRGHYYYRLFDICVNQCEKLPNCLLSFLIVAVFLALQF